MRRVLRAIERALSEPVMGLLAILAVAVTLAPIALDPAPRARVALDLADWAVVALFGLEYAVKLALAPSRRRYALAPAHLLDLFIVVTALAALLPFAPEALGASPVLRLSRLSRLARVAALGARATGIAVSESAAAAAGEARRVPLEIRDVRGSGPGQGHVIGWDELLAELGSAAEDWFALSGVHAEDLPRLAQALGVPADALAVAFSEAAYPRLDQIDGWLAAFVWYPRIRGARGEPGGVAVERSRTLILGSGGNLVTLEAGAHRLGDLRLDAASEIEARAPFRVRVLYGVLRHLLARYEQVIGALEAEVRALEDLPPKESTPAFLEGSFRLKRQVAAVRADLWHFRRMVRAVAERRVTIQGFEAGHRALFEVLVDDADHRYETATNIRETLLSLIELHLNVASFEMNKVMRILAIMTALALIPSVAGGLLGMNLAGNPWPATLPEVAFGVGVAMSLCLYLFAIRGWFR